MPWIKWEEQEWCLTHFVLPFLKQPWKYMPIFFVLILLAPTPQNGLHKVCVNILWVDTKRMKLLCSDELPFAPIFMRKFNKRNLLNQPYKVFCLVILQIKRYLKTWKSVFLLDRHQQGPIRPVLLVITGLVGWLVGYLVIWLVGWLVGNAVFSETCSKEFSDFLHKVRSYKGRKVTEPDFWKKFLIWRYWQKSLQISPKSDTLIFFSKTALFFWFLAWS